MRTILLALLLAKVAVAADVSYVVVGRLAETPEAETVTPEIATLVDLLAKQRPPIPVARAREGAVPTSEGPKRFLGLTVPIDSFERAIELGLELAPEEFTRPTRPVH